MPSNFPTSVDSFGTKVDHVTHINAADVNDLQDAVTAIESTLKTSPNPNPLDFLSKSRADTATAAKHLSTFTLSGGRPWYDIMHPSFAGGAVIGGDCVAATNAVIAALPTGGGTILVPGSFLASAALSSISGTRSVKFMGLGIGITNGAPMLSQITYSGTARFLNATGTTSFEWNGIGFVYTNASLAGIVFDVGDDGAGNDSFRTLVANSLFTGSGSARGANPMWRLNKTNISKFFHCNLNSCAVAVRGRDATSSNYSNIVEFDGVAFGQIGSENVTAAVANAGESWYFHHCNFERLYSGAAGAYITETGTLASLSLTFGEGCWFGDVLLTSATAGTWLKLGLCIAATITGCRFGGSWTGLGHTASSVAIEIAAGGAVIQGNSFDSFVTVVNLTVNGATEFVDIGPNYYVNIPFLGMVAPAPGSANSPSYHLFYKGQDYYAGPTMPAVGGIAATLVSAVLTADSTDRRGTIHFVTQAGPPAAFANLFTVTFLRQWLTPPRIFLQQLNAVGPYVNYLPFAAGAVQFSVSNGAALGGGLAYDLQYECVG